MTDEDWIATVLDGWRRGQRLGAVGPGPVDDHLAHARAIAALLPDDARAGLDLGSGAGIPGLALAGIRPAMRWVLVDASHRRTRLVAEIIGELGWTDRVEAVHERAETAGRDPRYRRGFDVVVSRSFGPPAVTAECAAPFARAGGRVLVAEPPHAAPDRWPTDGLHQLGLTRGARTVDPAIQVLESTGALDDRFPRRAGVPERRPLW